MRLLNVNCLTWNKKNEERNFLFFSSETIIVFVTSQAYFLKWQFYEIYQFEYQLKIQDKVVSHLSCFCSKYDLCTWTIYCRFLTDFRVYPCTQKKSLKSLFNLIVPHHQLPAYAYTEYEAFPSERIKKHFMNTKIYTADLEYLHLCLHLFLRVRKGQLKLSGFKE